MIIQSQNDLKKLQIIGSIVANCLEYMITQAQVGMSTWDLDQLGKAFLENKGAKSAPILCYDFPGHTCISINQEAAHGIPRKEVVLKAGDLINIDVSAAKDGIFADTGASFILPPKDPRLVDLLKTTRSALKKAISKVRAGEGLNIIGKTIEQERGSFTIIENLCSHGIGTTLHEEPQQIPSFYNPKDKRMLAENMVITIEPFLSTGNKKVDDGNDGWTLINPGLHYSAQYEHTMVIRKGKPPIVVTQL